jgi:hypothetical protein
MGKIPRAGKTDFRIANPGVGRSATPELFFADFPSENATGAGPAVLLARTLQSVPHTSAGETK